MSTERPSDEPVRTPEQPMAFRRDEVLGGGLTTWLLFVVLLPIGILLSSLAHIPSSSGWPTVGSVWDMTLLLAVVTVVGGIVALFVLPFAVLIAWPIANTLRRVRSIPVHVLIYTALGVVVGITYLAITHGPQLQAPIALGGVIATMPALAVAIAVPLGWWLTARRALRKDAGLTSRRTRRVDDDALHEDRLSADATSAHLPTPQERDPR